MRVFLFSLSMVFAVSIQAASADENFSKEIEKSSQIAPSVFLIEGAGGNVTAFIGKSGIFLVDDDFAEMAEKLSIKLKELGGGSPRYIVNTHFHYDHTGGNAAFSSTATIIAAKEVRDRLKSEQILWHAQHPPVPENGLPNLVFNQSLELYFNDEQIRIVHLPHGHTDGDTVVFFEKAKVVSMGDLYFAGMYPIFHPEHNGSLEGLVRDLEWILKQSPPDAKFVPGHGPVSDKLELKRYTNMIISSISTVKSEMKKGLTLNQIQKKGLDPKWGSFSHGYRNTDQWIESIYKEFSRKDKGA